jgi:hypothetical protein
VFISKKFKQLFGTVFALCGNSNYFENRKWWEDNFLQNFEVTSTISYLRQAS